MTRTDIRHTLSALAAVALVIGFASSPASAQGKLIGQGIGNYATNGNEDAASKVKPKSQAKVLATKKRPPKPIVGMVLY